VVERAPSFEHAPVVEREAALEREPAAERSRAEPVMSDTIVAANVRSSSRTTWKASRSPSAFVRRRYEREAVPVASKSRAAARVGRRS